jgi:hypothetical protein
MTVSGLERAAPGEAPGREATPVVRPPRRRRSPWWLLLALAAVPVLFVGLDEVGDLLPSLRNPFVAESVDRSQPSVLKALEDLSRYQAATGHFQLVIDLEKDFRHVPALIRGERTLFVAAGTVDAYVDFAGIDAEALRVSDDRRRVAVSLPHARLSEPRVDPARSYVASRERGLLDRLGSVFSDSPTSERELYLLAEEKLTSAAREGSLVAAAESNTRTMLEGMLRSLGFSDVTVSFG